MRLGNMLVVLTGLSVALSPSRALAQTETWVGLDPSFDFWSAGPNWADGSVPSSSVD